MADLSSSAAPAANNPYSLSIPLDLPPVVGGLVQHALISASVQVTILSIVDETGSATIGDIMTQLLPTHPDPAGAIAIMIRLHILCAELRNGVMDANTTVRRCEPPRSPDDHLEKAPIKLTPSGNAEAPALRSSTESRPSGLLSLEATPFSARVVVGPATQRRDFMRLGGLHRCGIYGLVSATGIYVGMGGDVGQRIATGQQAIADIETIFAITDANGGLSSEDARVCERIFWSRTESLADRRPVNKLPDGGVIDAHRYSQLDLFVTEACLALRQQGLLFTRGSVRSLFAGPRNEPGRVGPLRLANDAAPGKLHELSFGSGMVALATRETKDRWLLLRGSDVRGAAVATAGAGPSFLRAAWEHAGLLERSADGSSYVVSRDLVFGSASAAAVFVTGAKGRGWTQIDPNDGGMPASVAA